MNDEAPIKNIKSWILFMQNMKKTNKQQIIRDITLLYKWLDIISILIRVSFPHALRYALMKRLRHS